LEIQIVTAPYFLGTKLDAFFGRGKGDYLVSHDMEDIINLINGRVEIIEEIKNSEADLKEFIINTLKGFVDDDLFLEALPGHLLPDQASQGRRSIILERIKIIVDLGSN
jgi:hypothetical protein